MKAWEIGDQQGIGSLRLATQKDPETKPGHAVIKVHASALNHRDLMIMQKKYGATVRPADRVPLSDGAGEVIAVGEGVTNVKIGDRVVANMFANWIDGPWVPGLFSADYGNTISGWGAERLSAPAASLATIPDHLSWEEAATMASAGVTAWNNLYPLGDMKAGDTVLVLGTGGVSIWGLQLAKAGGARVIVTSSSDEKLAKAKSLGADITINYRTTPEWDKEVLKATDGVGADIVIETVGTGTLTRSLNAAAFNGRIGMIGGLEQGQPQIFALVGKNLHLFGITVGSVRMLKDMLASIAVVKLKPVVDKVFAFADMPAAYKYLDSAEHIGKVVIKHG
ncbi:MAG: NAD(P)-dependent alcohol dehydrogenase [Alphaproteobacteria bacterium]|nr:NAD(P)-dependent alcohol dehydrogenase [Alphaproteobacteria bacterium]